MDVTDRQADRQTERQADRQSDRQITSYLESGAVCVPGAEVLRVLGGYPSCRAIGSPEYDGYRHLQVRRGSHECHMTRPHLMPALEIRVSSCLQFRLTCSESWLQS